jgi:hypothetical protein
VYVCQWVKHRVFSLLSSSLNCLENPFNMLKWLLMWIDCELWYRPSVSKYRQMEQRVSKISTSTAL